jgi:hypothetical protein
MGLMASLPLRRKPWQQILSPLKIHHPWLGLTAKRLKKKTKELLHRPESVSFITFSQNLRPKEAYYFSSVL